MAEKSIGHEPPYTYPKPPEWDGLVASAASSIDPNRHDFHQTVAADAVWEIAHRLDWEAIENNRFFSIGLAMCKVAISSFKPMGDPTSMADIVSKRIAARHSEQYGSMYKNLEVGARHGLYLGELNQPLSHRIPDHIEAEYNTLGLAERIVIEALPLAYRNLAVLPAQERERTWKGALSSGLTLSGIVDSTYAGISRLTRTALIKLYEKKTGSRIDTTTASNIPIKNIASEEELRDLIPLITSMRVASLRSDELDNLSNLIVLDEANAAQLDRSKVPAEPLLLKGKELERVRHQRRLGCPARRIKGLIKYATSTFPEVVIAAQQQVITETA